jgi:hypothetical protein
LPFIAPMYVCGRPDRAQCEGDDEKMAGGGKARPEPGRVKAEQIGAIESVLTVTGGDVVYSAPPIATFRPERLPPVSPAWSPVAVFGGYQQHAAELAASRNNGD